MCGEGRVYAGTSGGVQSLEERGEQLLTKRAAWAKRVGKGTK